jgi:ribosomal protein S18 acetylase RimI-like enzyme
VTVQVEGGEPERAQVVRVDETHIALLADFIREVWDPSATPEKVCRARAAAAAANPLRAGEDIPTFLFLRHGRAVGHVTTIPIRLWSAGVERPAHWLKGLMVLPEYRNGPIGFLLLREAARQLQTALALVVQPAARRLFQALGFTDLGAIPNFVVPLEPVAMLRRLDLTALGLSDLPAWVQASLRRAQGNRASRLVGAGISGVLSLWRATCGRSAGFDVRVTESVDVGECDALWRQARGHFAAAPSRDGRYLRSRYIALPDAPYIFVTVREGSTLVALAVVRQPRTNGDPRLRGILVATISEVLFPARRPEAGLAALWGAERAARSLRADALLCTAAHSSVARLLARRGFLNVGGNVHFLIRAAGDGQPLPHALYDWCLTRGDGEADEVF